MQEFRKIPSLDFRYEVSRNGIVRNVKSKKIKKQKIESFGYYRTNYSVNKTNPHYNKKHGWDRPVHQLVMECWGPAKPEGKYIIDHIDRNKLNNDISNLRWVTYSENTLNQDMSVVSHRNSMNNRNTPNKKRIPVELVNSKTGESHCFVSRWRAAEWLILTGQSNTKCISALGRRIAIQKHIHGYDIHNINAERLADKA